MAFLCQRGHEKGAFGRNRCRVDSWRAVEWRFRVNAAKAQGTCGSARRIRCEGLTDGNRLGLCGAGGTPFRFAPLRPLPPFPASLLAQELVSGGPHPLPLCGGAQAPRHPTAPIPFRLPSSRTGFACSLASVSCMLKCLWMCSLRNIAYPMSDRRYCTRSW